MRKLLLLPVTVPLAAARGALEAAARTIVDAIAPRSEPEPAPVAEAVETAPPIPEPTAPVARPRPRPVRPGGGDIHDDEPTRGEVARRREALREAEADAGGPGAAPGAEVRIDPPWEGYDDQPAREIIAALIDADEATKGVVRLYEAANRNRMTVLRAAEA
jgi:hypothetical protein